MTIFPCRRCGGVPDVTCIQTSITLNEALILHKCSNGRQYLFRFKDCDKADAADGVIYLWNEAEAGDNPRWWPERYDYLHDVWKTQRREAPK